MKYLITDLNVSLDGHKYGFLDNLMTYAGENKSNDSFIFLTNNSSEFKLKSTYSHIVTLQITAEEQQKINQADGILKKTEEEWKLIKAYTQTHNCNRLILMEIDLYQIEIGKDKSPFKIAGIWFRPYSRLQAESNAFKARILHFKNKLQKKLIMKWALRNKNLDKIFILNDEEMPKWLNGKTPRFFTLPDPYFKYQQEETFNLRKHYQISEEKLILLQFGFMDERKNNENILTALNSLPENLASKITLLLIGKFKKDYDKELQKLKNGSYQLIMRNEFISNEEMESTFSQSDVILRMNVGFFGSSGIVGIAAHHNKPVIVSNTGVMAELVERYQLGDVIDPYNSEIIKETIVSYLENTQKLKINGEAYRKSHDLKAFAETLLS